MTKRGRPRYPDKLTPAEWRVIEGVRHGLTNPAIAQRCGITTDAVKFHVSNALTKLGLSDRKELRAWSGVRLDSAMAQNDLISSAQAWEIGQVSRFTRNLDRAADWFREIVGLSEVIRTDNMVFFECGFTRIYISEGNPAQNSILYFKVGDIHGEIERLRAASVEVISAPHRIHVHQDGSEEWMAFFNDPDDSPLALMSLVQTKPGEQQ